MFIVKYAKLKQNLKLAFSENSRSVYFISRPLLSKKVALKNENNAKHATFTHTHTRYVLSLRDEVSKFEFLGRPGLNY